MMRVSLKPVICLVLLFLISACFSITGMAAGGSLNGVIRDSSGSPLAGVWVTLFEGRFSQKSSKSALTNWEGKFELANLIPGIYSLQVNAASYTPLIKSGIKIFSGRIAELTLTLESLYPLPLTQSANNKSPTPPREDIEAVLRSTATSRPILRLVDSGNSSEPSHDVALELAKTAPRSNEMRGIVNFYTTAYTADPYLLSTGGMFTEFALVRDLNASANMTLAAVVSDAGYAEVDTLIRLKNIPGHHPTFRASFGQLPFVNIVAPIADGNLQRLNIYSFDFQDEIQLSRLLTILYGMEVQGTNARQLRGTRLLPRWSLETHLFKNNRTYFLHTNSLPSSCRTLELPDGESMVFSSPFHHELANRPHLGLPDVVHSEFASSQQINKDTSVIVGVYADRFRTSQLDGFTMARNDFSPKGVRVAFHRALSDFLSATLGYTYGGGVPLNQASTPLFQISQFHVVTSQVTAEMPQWGSRFGITYRWISSPSITVIDPYQEVFETSSPRLGLNITQTIPYVGRFIPGRLEAQLELRNLLANNETQSVDLHSLRRIAFATAPKSINGGLKLSF